VGDELADVVRRRLSQLVSPEAVEPQPPSLEDVFVLQSEEGAQAA
jgi:hypothetical protein